MIAKTLDSLAAAEALIIAAVIGIGAEVVVTGTGVLAFGLAWAVPVLIDRVRRDA